MTRSYSTHSTSSVEYELESCFSSPICSFNKGSKCSLAFVICVYTSISRYMLSSSLSVRARVDLHGEVFCHESVSEPVILSAAKNLPRPAEILRCAQNDRRKDWCLRKTSLCKHKDPSPILIHAAPMLAKMDI